MSWAVKPGNLFGIKLLTPWAGSSSLKPLWLDGVLPRKTFFSMGHAQGQALTISSASQDRKIIVAFAEKLC